MRRVLVCLVISSGLFALGQSEKRTSSCEWLAQSFSKIEKLHPGSTRAELLHLFRRSGGFSDAYVFKECSYITVDVTFETNDRRDGKRALELPSDKIVGISKPYLRREPAD